jgi:sucrose-6-phosphate hydrolase SacC (GH32 family)
MSAFWNRFIIASLLLTVIFLTIYFLMRVTVKSDGYHEKHRPQLHFSPPKGWLNDPNGLVYENGLYHLYYQHYPYGTIWNTMHWGHATSIDLIHWENQNIAIYPTQDGAIFSGSTIIDEHNVTGFATSQSDQPLIAIFTLNEKDMENQDVQSQAIAYSYDHGMTFTHYEDNPVIPNPGVRDFRDPNVVMRDDGKYLMSLAVGDKISFYSSDDLKSWTHLSDFSEGDHSGVWECPALFSLHVKDESMDDKYDILIISENSDAHGSMSQYFVGKFDGTKYERTSDMADGILWLDHGPDNYASIPYHNDPYGRIVVIGWMSNWIYANDTPTDSWRGQTTIPRELQLVRIDGKLRLKQTPVIEFDSLMDKDRRYVLDQPITIAGNDSVNLHELLEFQANSMLNMEYEINFGNATAGVISISFSNNRKDDNNIEEVIFSYDITKKMYSFDRTNSGDNSFSPRFDGETAGVRTFPRVLKDSTLTGRIILDVSSIEIFADGGLNSMTSLFYPSVPYDRIKVSVEQSESPATLTKLEITALNRIWDS